MTGRAGGVSLLLLVAAATIQAERLPVRVYTIADGLSNNSVQRIVRDSRGFLWFCTPDGLSRFDGYSFKPFGVEAGLPLGPVTDVLETTGGEYWVATGSGIVRFDRTGAHKPIVPAGSDRRSRSVTVLRQTRDGTIWVGTQNGLFTLREGPDGAALAAVNIGLKNGFPEQGIVADILEDKHQTLWIGTPVGLYRRWPDGTVAHYSEPHGMASAYVSSLFEDRNGQWWVGTRSDGFFTMTADATPAAPRFGAKMSTAEGMPYPWVTDLFESSDGRFWVGTSKGIAELLPGAGGARRQLRVYAMRDGIAPTYVSSIAEDAGGNVWFGSSLIGAMKLTPGGFATTGAEDSIEAVLDTFEDRAGHVCIRALVATDGRGTVLERHASGAAERALDYRFGCGQAGAFEWVVPKDFEWWGWVHERVTLQAQNGEWWIGGHAGVYRYPPTADFTELAHTPPMAVYRRAQGLAADQVYRLFEDGRGDVWISTISSETRGLSRFDRRTGTLVNLAGSPGLPSLVRDLPRSFGEDRDGNIWIAFNDGLTRYRDGAFTFFTPQNGVPPGAILNIHVDREGRVWMASERSGLIRLDNRSTGSPTFGAYTAADGLSSSSIAAITEDNDGFLYLGGGHGIDRFDPRTAGVRRFTASDGLHPGILKSAYRAGDGALWFGMSNGSVRLVPAPSKPPQPPRVLISGLRIAGESQPVSPFGEADMSLADLKPQRNQVEIEFVGLGFQAGEVLRYQYKLEDADTDWGPPTARRTVTYARLSAGDYTFAVRAVNADRTVSETPATIRFRVLPPFWLRWWFISSGMVAALALATLAYRYRVRRLLELANMRTHIATDLHDDIGANLTRIALLSEVAKRSTDNEPLESIATIARESVGAMSDIVWAVNPKRETLRDLTRRMRQHADELFTQRDIQLRFAGPADDTRRLGMDVRRDVLLVFKEAVNNAARHSNCTAVDITLRVDNDTLSLTVADNGRGLPGDADTEGNGLASMRRRAARLQGTLTISPRDPTGTLVTLSVPL